MACHPFREKDFLKWKANKIWTNLVIVRPLFKSMHACALNCQVAVSELEPIDLESLSLHMLLGLAGRRDVALDIGGRGALWGAVNRAWSHCVSAKGFRFAGSLEHPGAKTPLTARRPKRKVPLVEALIAVFFNSAHCKSLRNLLRWLGIGTRVAASVPCEAMSTESNDLSLTWFNSFSMEQVE